MAASAGGSRAAAAVSTPAPSRIRNSRFAVRYSHALHRWAVVTAACTLLLILAGGLVTSLGVGLAVPDWPRTFGYGLFTCPLLFALFLWLWLTPSPAWLRGVGSVLLGFAIALEFRGAIEVLGADPRFVAEVLVEHGHRLLGALVGCLTLILCGWLWARETRRWVRILGSAALGLVVLQGILGGLRVTQIDVRYAVAHACLAQTFFAVLATMAVVTSRGWTGAAAGSPTAGAGWVRGWSLAALVAVALQIATGALLRHTLGMVYAHLTLALGAAVTVAAATWPVLGRGSEWAALRGPARALLALLAAQVGLGIASWLTLFGPDGALRMPSASRVVATVAHVGVSALLLAAALALALRAWRAGRAAPEGPPIPAGEDAERSMESVGLVHG